MFKYTLLCPLMVLAFMFVEEPLLAQDDTLNWEHKVLNGLLLDAESKEPLLYASVSVVGKGRGSVTNEVGMFSLQARGVSLDDSLRFQHLGYLARTLSIKNFLQDSVVYLNQEIISLNEFLVFSEPPSATDIVAKVVANLERNYPGYNQRQQTFVRFREDTELDQFALEYKKSNIPGIDWEAFDEVNKTISKKSTSYSDFLGDLYFSSQESLRDSFKIDPIQRVSLQDKDPSEPGQLIKALEGALKDTDEEEYWKIKSGIIGVKIDIDNADTVETASGTTQTRVQTESVRYMLKGAYNYSRLTNEDEWEFLYSPSKYRFEIMGGTKVNGELVYIIDFTPKNRGLYQGRMFVSTETYALIRADYSYASDKLGTDIDLIGLGYTESAFHGTIYFERVVDGYQLKYLSRRKGYQVRLERNFALLKKKERFFIDKKLQEVKLGVSMRSNSLESIELLVISENDITREQYTSFDEPKHVPTISVEQFDDFLWEDYDIIEPTTSMKNYRKSLD